MPTCRFYEASGTLSSHHKLAWVRYSACLYNIRQLHEDLKCQKEYGNRIIQVRRGDIGFFACNVTSQPLLRFLFWSLFGLWDKASLRLRILHLTCTNTQARAKIWQDQSLIFDTGMRYKEIWKFALSHNFSNLSPLIIHESLLVPPFPH